jgi:DNA primase large subunit|tara:strand:+ start:701 stop:1969 length:1269 start_codon:yes stop_codon:yes gene_type:complete
MNKEVLNPFSEEAIEIVKNSPLAKGRNGLSNIKKDQVKKVKEWIKSGGTNTAEEEDILFFSILLATIALRFGSYSKESKLATEIIKMIISGRVGKLISEAHKNDYDENKIISIFSQFFNVVKSNELLKNSEDYKRDLERASSSMSAENRVKYGIQLSEIFPAISTRKLKLNELLIINGHAHVSQQNLIKISIYKLEALITKFLDKGNKIETENTIPVLKPLEDLISKWASNPDEYLRNLQKKMYYAVKSGTFIGKVIKGGKALNPDLFPPCIVHTLDGVSSGSRNYSITVLLTSFISYARIAPIGSKKNSRISEYIDDINVIEEILSIIYRAAGRCYPPLLDDQPMEKMNILYHLGLGLDGDARLELAGNSNWYFPPNCDKIRREAPSLCRQDKHCKRIKNPLSYYSTKIFSKKKNIKNKKL